MTVLEELPVRMDRMELQILQLREEMSGEFSAVRAQMREGQVVIVTALTEQIQEARRHTSVLFEESLGRIAVVGEGLAALSLRVDGVETTLSQRFDATGAKIDLILARLDNRTKPNPL